MEIKRVLNFSDEEFDKLIAAGEFLGKVSKSKEEGTFDELSGGAEKIINALKDVVVKILEK